MGQHVARDAQHFLALELLFDKLGPKDDHPQWSQSWPGVGTLNHFSLQFSAPEPKPTIYCPSREVLETSLNRYTFYVDFARTEAVELGVGIMAENTFEGVRILRVRAGSAVAGWNQRCLSCYPADAVRDGDLIINVNGVGPRKPGLKKKQACQEMMHQISTADEMLWVVRR